MAEAYIFDGAAFRPQDWRAGRALRWAAWRPDGSAALLVGNGGTALLYDGARLQSLSTGDRENLRGAAWAPDGSIALMAGNGGAVYRISGERVDRIDSVTSENLRRVAWHPSGSYALIVGNGGTVIRYDAATAALDLVPGDRAHTLRSIAFHPSGSYALVGAFASQWAGYPRPHALYRCDGRYLQALIASDDEDDMVSVDWTDDGLALISGYSWDAERAVRNKAMLYDGSVWRTLLWQSRGVVLGGAWQPGGESALLVGESGLALKLNRDGGLQELETNLTDNLIGPFWRPGGSTAIVLKGPGERVYTV